MEVPSKTSSVLTTGCSGIYSREDVTSTGLLDGHSEPKYERDPLLNKLFGSEVIVTNVFNTETGDFSIHLKPANTVQNAVSQADKASVSSHLCQSNFLGSSAVGFVSGLVGAGILLIKDATLGVLIPGGPQYWGSERIVPMTFLVLVSTLGSGFVGYYNHVNLLDAFY